MKINLAKSAGFCFGVKRALDIASKTIESQEKIYVLGDIVHNEEVAEELKKSGVKKVEKLHKRKKGTFLIRAHGASVAVINRARRLGYKIVDATCPMVKEIHSIAKAMEDKGNTIIIIGDKKHDEVYGIMGQLKTKPIVIDSPGSIVLKQIKKIKKAAVVVQSTQNIEKAIKIVDRLKEHIKELRFFNTICKPTSIKQQEIKKMPRQNDVMIVIGSKTSANTKRLFEISNAINKRSFWVHSKRDIKPDWFKGAQSVGVSAGASTPQRTIKEIVEYITQIS